MIGFLIRKLKSRRKWNNIFQLLKERNCQPRILHLVKISFRNETEIKTFSKKKKKKGKLRGYVANISTLKRWLRNFSKQKENDERRNLGMLGRKTNGKSKIRLNVFSFSS